MKTVIEQNLSREQLIIITERLVSIEEKLVQLQEKLSDHTQNNAECINSLRQDVRPVIEFYDRIETVGIVGRATLFIVGALLAMAAAFATVMKTFKSLP